MPDGPPIGEIKRLLWIGVKRIICIPCTLPNSVRIDGGRGMIIYILVIVGNSTSNFFFMYIAIKGAIDSYRARIPIRFILLYVSIFVVGLGSLLFHATLKWSMQLLDEIPMIFMATQILHCM